jgi:hypothetical protein
MIDLAIDQHGEQQPEQRVEPHKADQRDSPLPVDVSPVGYPECMVRRRFASEK